MVKKKTTKHPLDHQEIKTEAVKRSVIQSYEQTQNPEPWPTTSWQGWGAQKYVSEM